MKGKKLLLTTVLAASFTVMLGAPSSADTVYTPVAGTTCSFNKYLIMDKDDVVPNATFSFTAAPGTGIAATAASGTTPGTVQVLPGVGTPVIPDVTFAPGDATETSAGTYVDVARPASDRDSTLDATTGVQLETSEKFATKPVTVSFTGITFDEPGVYRYIITETADAAHTAAGIMHDNDVDRVLDVYVVDKGNGTLEVSSYVMHKNADTVPANDTNGSGSVTIPGAALADKTDGFTNEYSAKDLVIKKEVTGNQASRDKWFEITVKLTGVGDDDTFVVSIADDGDDTTTDGNADATTGTTSATRGTNQGKTNPTSVTGAALKAGQKFYLQHGQSIAIRGIAPSVTYTVTEDAEDYKSINPSAYTTGLKVDGYGDPTTGVMGTVAGNKKAVMTSYLNQREGIIPTGIIISAAGLIIAAIIVVAGIVFFGVRSRRKYEEE